MDSNLIVLTDQDGNSVRFELLDIVEYKEDEYAVLYPADGGDDEPVHILRIISENLDVNEAEFEGLDDDELIDTIYSSDAALSLFASATIWTTDCSASIFFCIF